MTGSGPPIIAPRRKEAKALRKEERVVLGMAFV